LLALAAAVVLGLGLSMFHLARRVAPTRNDESEVGNAASKAVAVLTCAMQPEWEGKAPAIGSKFRAGERLRLLAGIAQLEFFSGAVLIVEGPADFEPLDAGRVYCREGRLRARVSPLAQGFTIFRGLREAFGLAPVSPPAQGFTIVSPKLELVDRGTEFGFRIDRAGGAEVHVFEGKVDLHNTGNSLGADSRHLTAGNGASIDPNGAFRKIAADPDAFVSTANLEQQWRGEMRRRQERWLTHSQKLRADSRLILYYTFQNQQSWERTLHNQALVQKGDLNGAIIGCAWSEGRWPGKGALDFKRPSDRIRLRVPGTYQSLTFLAWLRVDSFDQHFSALMLTDGFDEGAPHWQLLDEGRLRLGIKDLGPGWNSEPGYHDYDSPALLGPDRLGVWLQLATVYDRRSRAVTHYLDGRPVSREGLRFDVALRIGNVEIGNWGRIDDAPYPTPPHHRVRNFNGRIDEFAVFREALSAEEIARLYEFGKACP
jgi:hypothetical protein